MILILFPKATVMTIGELLADTSYTQKSILQKLIMYYCQISREDMWMGADTEITKALLDAIVLGYTKYVEEKMPLEYIVGKVTFLGNDFVVNQHTLIPRPETEYMIAAINEYIQTSQRHNVTMLQRWNSATLEHFLLDIGTGCGVLGLSVLLHNPDAFSWAILSDFSPEALEVARENYGLLEDRIKNWELRNVDFVHSSLLSFFDTSWIAAPSARNDETNIIAAKDIVLVANLPYIPDAMFDENVDETVKKWEPRMAFVGWDDGLDLYREMFEQLFQLKAESWKPKSLVMFLEMMTWQVDILRQEFGDKMEFVEVKTFHFNIRIVKAILS